MERGTDWNAGMDYGMDYGMDSPGKIHNSQTSTKKRSDWRRQILDIGTTCIHYPAK